MKIHGQRCVEEQNFSILPGSGPESTDKTELEQLETFKYAM